MSKWSSHTENGLKTCSRCRGSVFACPVLNLTADMSFVRVLFRSKFCETARKRVSPNKQFWCGMVSLRNKTAQFASEQDLMDKKSANKYSVRYLLLNYPGLYKEVIGLKKHGPF